MQVETLQPSSKMQSFKMMILAGIVFNVGAYVNETKIEEMCKNCTADGGLFIKLIFVSWSAEQYFCRQTPVLVSKFGMIVDYANSEETCTGIVRRPVTNLMREFYLQEDDCQHTFNINFSNLFTFILCLLIGGGIGFKIYRKKARGQLSSNGPEGVYRTTVVDSEADNL